MTTRLHRYYGADYLHFITCSCFRRLPLLVKHYALFVKFLEETRQSYGFLVSGYVLMPEHFHLLMGEPEVGTPSTVMQVLKQRFAHEVLKSWRSDGQGSAAALDRGHFWQPRFYDFVVWSEHKRIEKLRYMHRNPVKRGLVSEPEEWPWSSFRFYLHGERGLVTLNEERRITFKRTETGVKVG